jgi:hypothetical protein
MRQTEMMIVKQNSTTMILVMAVKKKMLPHCKNNPLLFQLYPVHSSQAVVAEDAHS